MVLLIRENLIEKRKFSNAIISVIKDLFEIGITQLICYHPCLAQPFRLGPGGRVQKRKLRCRGHFPGVGGLVCSWWGLNGALIHEIRILGIATIPRSRNSVVRASAQKPDGPGFKSQQLQTFPLTHFRVLTPTLPSPPEWDLLVGCRNVRNYVVGVTSQMSEIKLVVGGTFFYYLYQKLTRRGQARMGEVAPTVPDHSLNNIITIQIIYNY